MHTTPTQLAAPSPAPAAPTPSITSSTRRALLPLRIAAVLLILTLALVAWTGTAEAATTHTVKRGETLSAIARAYKVPGGFQAIAKANKLSNPNRIRVGQRLVIPSAKGKSAPPRRPSTQAASRSKAPATSTSVWDRLARCESGGNWKINTGNGYYGGLQFSASSWRWVGGKGLPHQASKAEQIKRAEILKSRQGWGAWPACSRKLGLR